MIVKFNQYINELSMKKGTHISNPLHTKVKSGTQTYNQEIILDDGLSFRFTGFYIRVAGIWNIQFSDENDNLDKAPKRKGASIELFAALEKVMMQFIEKTLPDKMEFRADLDEKSRVKLYDLLAKKIKKKYGFNYKRVTTSISVLYQFMHKSVQGGWLDPIE